MCNNSACLGYLFLVVLVGFAALIYFLLRKRESILSDNLQLSPDEVWKTVSQRAAQHGLSKSDLIYGIYQDKTALIRQIVIKDSNGAVIGQIEHASGRRGFDIILGNESYQVAIPLTWRKSAHLVQAGDQPLVEFERVPFSLKQHRLIAPEIGTLTSKGPSANFLHPFDYELNGKIIGISQSISTAPVGKIVVFPSTLPLHVRVFILAMNASGL